MKQLPRGSSNSCLITREQGLCFVQYLCNKSLSNIQNLFIHCGCRFDQLSFSPALVLLSSLKFIFDISMPVSTHFATTQRCRLKRALELVNLRALVYTRGSRFISISLLLLLLLLLLVVVVVLVIGSDGSLLVDQKQTNKNKKDPPLCAAPVTVNYLLTGCAELKDIWEEKQTNKQTNKQNTHNKFQENILYLLFWNVDPRIMFTSCEKLVCSVQISGFCSGVCEKCFDLYLFM